MQLRSAYAGHDVQSKQHCDSNQTERRATHDFLDLQVETCNVVTLCSRADFAPTRASSRRHAHLCLRSCRCCHQQRAPTGRQDHTCSWDAAEQQIDGSCHTHLVGVQPDLHEQNRHQHASWALSAVASLVWGNIRNKPHLAVPAVQHGSGKPLLHLERHHPGCRTPFLRPPPRERPTLAAAQAMRPAQIGFYRGSTGTAEEVDPSATHLHQEHHCYWIVLDTMLLCKCQMHALRTICNRVTKLQRSELHRTGRKWYKLTAIWRSSTML